MTLNELYRPVGPQLDAVRSRLQEFSSGAFRRPGKLLRPALVHLSALAAAPLVGAEPPGAGERLADAALALELVHGASLVHDDILDDETERRGVPALHGVWGTKTALLVGDALYARAFGLLAGCLPPPLLMRVTQMIEAMCQAEIDAAQTPGDLTVDQYLAILDGKTAGLMAVSCQLGAALAGAPDAACQTLEGFGRQFGLAYQLLDDVADGDARCTVVDGRAEAETRLVRAAELLRTLPESEGQRALLALGDLVGHHSESRRKP